MNHRHEIFTLIALAVVIPTSTARAATIINVPPDPAPFSVSGDTILNLLEGGRLPLYFDANSGSTVNITGGTIGHSFDAFSGSTVNFSGVDFKIDGVPVAGLVDVGDSVAVNLPTEFLFTGTLADGIPFAFMGNKTSFDENSFADGTLTLKLSAPPPAGPAVIDLPGDPAPLGVHVGQTINVTDGGMLGDDFNAGAGSTVNLHDGNIGQNFEAVGAVVNVTGGNVNIDFSAFANSTVNISGGTVGPFFEAWGSTVNISGGTVQNVFKAFDGSTVNMSGGTV